LKRIPLSIVIVFIAVSMAQAKMHVEFPAFSYIGTAVGHVQTGANLGLAYNITPDVDFLFRSSYNILTRNRGADDEEKYSYAFGIAGLQYKLDLNRFGISQLIWTASLGAGYCMITAEYERLSKLKDAGADVEPKVTDMGPVAAIYTGVIYLVSQHISLFLDVGYHRVIYTLGDYEDKTIHGGHLVFGVRFTFFGKNRDIFDGY
jgi:hypothetical protein